MQLNKVVFGDKRHQPIWIKYLLNRRDFRQHYWGLFVLVDCCLLFHFHISFSLQFPWGICVYVEPALRKELSFSAFSYSNLRMSS
jgi:hypothetical protein